MYNKEHIKESDIRAKDSLSEALLFACLATAPLLFNKKTPVV